MSEEEVEPGAPPNKPLQLARYGRTYSGLGSSTHECASGLPRRTLVKGPG